MNKTGYFQNIADKLVKHISGFRLDEDSSNFIWLKYLEYWVRFLQKSSEFLNPEAVLDLMQYEPKPLMAIAHDLASFDKENGASLCDSESFFEERRSKKTFCGKLAADFLDSYPLGNYEETGFEIIELIKNRERFQYTKDNWRIMQKTIAKHFIPFAIEKLSKGVSRHNEALKRIEKMQKLLRLSDEETEFVLFIWLSDNDELEIHRENKCKRNPRFSNAACDLDFDALALGMPKERISEMLAETSSLVKLCIINKEFELDQDLKMHLSGQRLLSQWSDIELAPPPKIPFEELRSDRSDADMLVYLLSHHDKSRPLNILFYGLAGTGKTELAKALADYVHTPMYMIKACDDFSTSFRETLGLGDKMLRRRMRNLQLAAWQCEKDKGIILVDEADHLLNALEKGTLNMLLESIHVPIIWISNSIAHIETSTRRRFNYSMEFKSFGTEKRAKVLKSVMNTYNVPDMFDESSINKIAAEFPVTAAGYTLAIQQAVPMANLDKAYSSTITRKILEAHANLLGIRYDSNREKDTHAPAYSLDGLNIDGDINEVVEIATNYNNIWDNLDKNSKAESLNILLYGASGTGKTEFVRYLARKLNRNLVIRRASDLLDMYVGQTEKNIREAFEEAEESKAILFFDEADSFIADRQNASRNFEVSQVNELLTQLENFNGIFVAATNFDSRLDNASRRRFALKLGFNYLKSDGIEKIWKSFYPQFNCPDEIKSFEMLTPGDFNAVFSRLRYLPQHKLSKKRIASELEKEIEAKGGHANRKMGF